MVQTSPWKDVLHAGTPPPFPRALFGFATGFMAIAFYLVFEVNLLVSRCFKKHQGLYFWSLLISSWGVFLHTIGYVLQWWVRDSPWILNTACIMFGWSAMVTCQSLVLYSRLHLVIRNYNILRGVLVLIVTTAIFIEIPQWVTTWASTDTKLSVTKLWTPYDSIMVRISQMVFLIQEATLSLLYIWGAVKVLSPNDKIDVRRLKWDLIYVNTYLILVDIIVLVLAYTNEHFPKEPVQNFAYAFKLKIEFVVLNQLVSVTQQSRSANFNAGNRYVRSGWTNTTPLAGKSNSNTDPAATSPKREYSLTYFAKGLTNPHVADRSESGSSEFSHEVKSPDPSHRPDQYFTMGAQQAPHGFGRRDGHNGTIPQDFYSSETLTHTHKNTSVDGSGLASEPRTGDRNSLGGRWGAFRSLVSGWQGRLHKDSSPA
ncbi:hypothetical protein ACLMJK_000338 [Lecanora helva]